VGVWRHLRLAPEHERFADDIQRSLVDELYERAKTSLVVLVLALVVMIRVLGPVYDASASIRGAFVALYVVVAARFALIGYYGTGPKARGTPTSRHVAFAVGATAVGMLMGWVNLLAYPDLSAARFGLYAMTLTGINSIALVSMGTSPAVYLGYVLYVSALCAMSLHEYRSRRDNVLLRLQLAELALLDSLTQVRNRRFLMEFMPVEVAQLLRNHRPRVSDENAIALMMIDLDHFKAINDRFGHDAGDVVLREFAAILRETVRRPDVVARWGGEEFVIIARGLGTDGAAALATRIRERVAAHEFRVPTGDAVRCTCSIGYSLFPFLPEQPGSIGWQQVLALADAAMYQAKQRGRDRAIGVLPGAREAKVGVELLEAVKRDMVAADRDGLIRLEAAA
jgi:diguanylate cyclase (GGDEF)-like protein